jgi:predicted DNA-binding protein
MTKVNYHLADRQIEALKELSRKEGLTVAELIRRAIDAWLEKNKSSQEHKS